MKFPIKWNGYTIRPEKTSDAKGVKKLFDSLIIENADILRNKKDSLKVWQKKIQNALKEKKSTILVAIKGKEIVGATNIALNKGKASHVGEYGISISKNERAKGLGSKLTETVISYAKEKLKGLELITLHVFKRNTNTIKLYEKLGFKIVAELPKTIKVNNEYLNEYVMHLWIK